MNGMRGLLEACSELSALGVIGWFIHARLALQKIAVPSNFSPKPTEGEGVVVSLFFGQRLPRLFHAHLPLTPQ